MKPSFTRVTGESDRIRPEDATTPRLFSLYVRQQLGIELPIGKKLRGLWYHRLTVEREIQGWSWSDLTATVAFLVNHPEIRIERIDGLFHYVKEARRYGYMVSSDEDLQAKVAEAISKEEDEHWARRLSLATGAAMAKVYQQWLQKERMKNEI